LLDCRCSKCRPFSDCRCSKCRPFSDCRFLKCQALFGCPPFLGCRPCLGCRPYLGCRCLNCRPFLDFRPFWLRQRWSRRRRTAAASPCTTWSWRWRICSKQDLLSGNPIWQHVICKQIIGLLAWKGVSKVGNFPIETFCHTYFWHYF